MTTIDVSKRSDECAITLLTSFAEAISTTAGRVTPDSQGFTLQAAKEGRKPRQFETAASAVRALRKLGGAK